MFVVESPDVQAGPDTNAVLMGFVIKQLPRGGRAPLRVGSTCIVYLSQRKYISFCIHDMYIYIYMNIHI